MTFTTLTADDLDRIHRLLSDEIGALRREIAGGLDSPEDRRAKEAELDAARGTLARVDTAAASLAMRAAMRAEGEAAR